MLVSLGDFEEFKDLMLSYKEQVAFESGEGGFALEAMVTPLTAHGAARFGEECGELPDTIDFSHK